MLPALCLEAAVCAQSALAAAAVAVCNRSRPSVCRGRSACTPSRPRSPQLRRRRTGSGGARAVGSRGACTSATCHPSGAGVGRTGFASATGQSAACGSACRCEPARSSAVPGLLRPPLLSAPTLVGLNLCSVLQSCLHQSYCWTCGSDPARRQPGLTRLLCLPATSLSRCQL